MVKFLGRQSVLWSICLNIWLIWGVCWLLVSPVYGAWETGYTHRKKGTFGTVDGGAHTWFPVLLTLDDTALKGCDDNGTLSHDIMFTETDGTSDLAMDWIDYTEDGDSSLIELYFSATGWAINDGTEFYMYYENAAAGDQNKANEVWDTNYVAVWHCHEAAGTLFDAADAVTGHDSAADDAEAYQNAGMNKYAVSYDGTADETQFTDHADFDLQNYTIELMFKYDVWAQGDVVFAHWDTVGDDVGISIYSNGVASPGQMRATLYAGGSNATAQAAAGSCTTGAFQLFHTTRTAYADPGTMQNYVNGDASGNPTVLTGEAASAGPPTFGAKSTLANRSDCHIEEVRWSNVARDANWMAFQYDNLNEADNEISWDAEESESSFIPKVIIISAHSGFGLCLIVFRRKKKK